MYWGSRSNECAGEAGAIQRVKVPPGYIYLVRLMFAEPCEQAFWDAASACLEAVE